MPKRTNAFQTLVYQLQRQLHCLPGCQVTESKELINKVTGQGREVDIVVEFTQGGVLFTLSFECTSLNRPADSTWVEQMLGKHDNLPTHRLILVSESGFYGPALKAVENSNLAEAVTLREAQEEDWGEYAKELSGMMLGGFSFVPVSCQVTSGPDGDGDHPQNICRGTLFRRLDDDLQLDSFQLALDILRNPEVGIPVMEKWHQEKRPAGEFNFTFSVLWEPTKGAWAVVDGNREYPLISFRVDAKGMVKETNLHFSFGTILGTRFAHAQVANPIPIRNAEKGETAIIAITLSEEDALSGSLAFPEAKLASEKVFNIDWNTD